MLKFPARAKDYNNQTNKNIDELNAIVYISDYLVNTLQGDNPDLYQQIAIYLKDKAKRNIEELGIGTVG